MVVSGSFARELLRRCLHLGVGKLHPFASPWAVFLLGQAFACAMLGTPAARTPGHSAPTPVELLDPGPLDGSSVVSRCVPLRTPAASGGGPSALRADVTAAAAVVVPILWLDLLVIL